jgi:G:T-mismatch repair DNA endonuclease (very short patch repair protein)
MSGMVDCHFCHRNVERDLTVVAQLDTTGERVIVCDDCMTRIDDDLNRGWNPDEDEEEAA